MAYTLVPHLLNYKYKIKVSNSKFTLTCRSVLCESAKYSLGKSLTQKINERKFTIPQIQVFRHSIHITSACLKNSMNSFKIEWSDDREAIISCLNQYFEADFLWIRLMEFSPSKSTPKINMSQHMRYWYCPATTALLRLQKHLGKPAQARQCLVACIQSMDVDEDRPKFRSLSALDMSVW